MTHGDDQDEQPVEHLPADACWNLLRSAVVGRLAVVVEEHPDIFPLNYVVDRDTVVFRTDGGTKLASALGGTPVALEVDGYDAVAEQAWSVVLRGRAEHIVRSEALAEARGLPLFPWQRGPKEQFVRIHMINISGRRFQVTKPDIWSVPDADARRASFE